MANEDLIAISQEVERRLAKAESLEQTKFEYARTDANAALNEGLPELINNDKKLQDSVEKHKKRKFNIFRKLDNNNTKNQADTVEYTTKYEKERIYYKRHQGILSQYGVPENSGFAKMRSAVVWDIFITWCCYILGFPVYLLKKVVELFANMRKSIMWTVLILVIVIVVVVGLVWGISALVNLIQQAPTGTS